MARPGAAPKIDDDELDGLERDLLGRAHGRVLEIGAGWGENFGAFPLDIEWIGLEPDGDRLAELSQRAREWGHATPPLAAVAEHIPLPDASIDTVVASYVLCTVPDVAAALAEVERVLVPGGRVLFVDHVIAPAGTLVRGLQHVATPFTKRLFHGCHWDRDPEPALSARFEAADVRTYSVPGTPFRVPTLLFDGRARAGSPAFTG